VERCRGWTAVPESYHHVPSFQLYQAIRLAPTQQLVIHEHRKQIPHRGSRSHAV
jgi:hypothetical protein